MWHTGNGGSGQPRPGVQQLPNVRGPAAGYGQVAGDLAMQQRRPPQDGHLMQQGSGQQGAPQVQQQNPVQQQQQQQRVQHNAGSQESVWTMYEQGAKIGEGTYGWVYFARSKETGRALAIKQIKEGREGDGVSHTAIREVMLLRELSHVNIVRLDSVHVSRSEASLWLAFEHAEHDLYEMIKFHRDHRENMRANPTGLMPHHIIKSVMWQLLSGLNYLHQNWIMHRDLKPSNVLVMAHDDSDVHSQGRVRIADFGLARIFQSPLRPLSENGVVVTIWYRAPELLLGARHYTRAVDVWAAGCILGELCMLRPLFQGNERKPNNPYQGDQVDRIFSVLGHPNVQMWPHLPHLIHWHNNTDNVRTGKPEYPAIPPLVPHQHQHQQQAREWGGLKQSLGVGSDAAAAGYQRGLGGNVAWAAKQLEIEITRNMRGALPSWANGEIPAECRVPAEAFDLLARMLEYDPSARITCEEALRHPYFTTHQPLPTANVLCAAGSRHPLIRYTKRTAGAAATAHMPHMAGPPPHMMYVGPPPPQGSAPAQGVAGPPPPGGPAGAGGGGGSMPGYGAPPAGFKTGVVGPRGGPSALGGPRPGMVSASGGGGGPGGGGGGSAGAAGTKRPPPGPGAPAGQQQQQTRAPLSLTGSLNKRARK